MKTIKILVEGTRDVALLASLFQVCKLNLSDVRKPKKDKQSKTIRPWYQYEFDNNGLVGEYEGTKDGERYKIEVLITGGYTNFDKLLNVFEDKDGCGIIPAVVFDADSSTDINNSGGSIARRKLLQKQYDTYSFQKKTYRESFYLSFP